MESIGFPFLTILAFIMLAGGALITDMLLSRKSHVIPLHEAIWRSVAYIGVACLFGGYLALAHGGAASSKYFAGFLMEKALSVDNLMVFTAIFSYFRIQSAHQQHILQYGIAGSVVLRLIFVALGVGALFAFGRITEVIFGLLVVWSAWAVLQGNDNDAPAHYDSQWYVRAAKRIWPVNTSTTDRLFVMGSMTPAFLCLITIEVSDIMFAFDSVPAVIGVTQDPLLVYSAVIFAILGLRALYFVLDAMRRYLVHLDKAVATILVFIAAKLIGHAIWEWQIAPMMNVLVVLSLLSLGVLASALDTRKFGEVA